MDKLFFASVVARERKDEISKELAIRHNRSVDVFLHTLLGKEASRVIIGILTGADFSVQ